MITIWLISGFLMILNWIVGIFPVINLDIAAKFDIVLNYFYRWIHVFYYYYLPHSYLDLWIPRVLTYFSLLLTIRIIIWLIKR